MAGQPRGGGRSSGRAAQPSVLDTMGRAQTTMAQVEESMRMGRRLDLLARSFPQLGADPNLIFALASSPTSDDDLMTQATDAISASQIDEMIADLSEAPTDLQRATFASYPAAMQNALRGSGYAPPPDPSVEVKEREGGNWFSINLPDWAPGPDEIKMGGSGEGVLGQVGEVVAAPFEIVQHGVGEALESTLHGIDWVGRLPGHAYRTMDLIAQQRGAGTYSHIATNPTSLLRAWSATTDGSRTFKLEALDRAEALVGAADLEIAKSLAADPGAQIADVIADLGEFTVGTPEFNQQVVDLYARLGEDNSKLAKAVEILSGAKVSMGRDTARSWGLDPNHGLGQKVSGAWDGAMLMALDPMLLMGKAKHIRTAARVGVDNADTIGDVNRYRILYAGYKGGSATGRDARIGAQIDRVVSRVRRTFDEADTGYTNTDLFNDMPGMQNAYDHMLDWHRRAQKLGGPGLDTQYGFMDFLADQAGQRALTSTRLGGFNPRHLEIPHLSNMDLAGLKAKNWFNEKISFANDIPANLNRIDEFATGATFGEKVANRVMVPVARGLHALTRHVPYENVLKLHGPESITQFRNLTEMGVFADMPRATVDGWVNQFATAANPGVRRLLAVKFLDDFFERAGVRATPEGREYADRFVGHLNQVYSIGGRDAIGNSRFALLPDAHHADAMLLPDFKGFLAATRKANFTRATTGRLTTSYFDAAIGRYWKPAVLLRIGFISRAAGEEVMNFLLRIGTGEYLRAKFAAPWAQLDPAHQELATARFPLFVSHSFDRLLQKYRPDWWASKALHIADKRMMALSMLMSRRIGGAAEKLHLPTRRGIGKAFAREGSMIGARAMYGGMTRAQISRLGAWDPKALEVKRHQVLRDGMRDPVFARAFAELIGGSTWEPLNFRDPAASLAKIFIPERRGNKLVQVPLRVKRGEQQIYRLAETDANGAGPYYLFNSSVMQADSQDRVGRELLSVMMDAPGPSVERELVEVLRRRGIDVTQAGGAPEKARELVAQISRGKHRELLRRHTYGWDEMLDDVEDPIRHAPGELANDMAALATRFAGTEVGALLEEWENLSYRTRMFLANGSGGRIIRTRDELVSRLVESGRARMSDPDMTRSVREMTAANADAHGRDVVNPVPEGMQPLHLVSLGPETMSALMNLEGGHTSTVAWLTDALERFGLPKAERVARELADSAWDAMLTTSEGPATLRVGMPDARTAQQVKDALARLGGRDTTLARLDLPEDAVRRAVGRDPLSDITSGDDDWKDAVSFKLPQRLVDRAEPLPETFRTDTVRVSGTHHDELVGDAEYTETLRRWYAPVPEGHVRLYRGQLDDSGEAAVNVRADKYDMHRAETIGMWWTDDMYYASSMAKTRWGEMIRHPEETGIQEPQLRLYFVDVPQAEAERFWLGRPDAPEELLRQTGPPFTDTEWVIDDPAFVAGRRPVPLGMEARRTLKDTPVPPGLQRVWVIHPADGPAWIERDENMEIVIESMHGHWDATAYDLDDTYVETLWAQQGGDVHEIYRQLVHGDTTLPQPAQYIRQGIGPGKIVAKHAATGMRYDEQLGEHARILADEFIQRYGAGSGQVRRHVTRTAVPGEHWEGAKYTPQESVAVKDAIELAKDLGVRIETLDDHDQVLAALDETIAWYRSNVTFAGGSQDYADQVIEEVERAKQAVARIQSEGEMVPNADLVDEFEGVDIMHELVAPNVWGEFSMDDLTMVPGADLPDQIYGPALYHAPDGRWDRIVRFGFDRVIGPAISAIIREPLFLYNFDKGMKNARWVEPLLRDTGAQDDARAISRRLFGSPAFEQHVPAVPPTLRTVTPEERMFAGSSTAVVETGGEEGYDIVVPGIPGSDSPEALQRLADAWHDLPDWAKSAKTSSRDVNALLQKKLGLEDPARAQFMVPDEAGELTFDVGGYKALQQARAEGSAMLNPFDLSRDEIRQLRRFAENDLAVNTTIRDVAIDRAVTDSIPFIDDHKVRSQFQEYVGNLIPFHFAEEAFLKRWARTLVDSPQAIRRGQLIMNGVRSMGFVTDNEFGEEVFVMPGSTVVTNLIGQTPIAKLLTGGAAVLPVPSPLTFQVQYMSPGFDRLGAPSFGPYVGVLTSNLARVFPELADAEEAIMGRRGAGRSLASYFVPTSISRFYHAITDNPDASQMASAAIEAAAYLEANDLGPPDNATPEQLEEYQDRLVDHARIVALTRAIVGFVGPTTPDLPAPDDLHPEFVTLLQSMPVGEAVDAFIKVHPNATPYMVFSTRSVSGAPLHATAESLEWMEKNRGYLDTFSAAGPWLLPQPDSTDPYERRAFYQQLSTEMRLRKTPIEWVRDAKFAKASQDYFDNKDRYEEARAALGPDDVEVRRDMDSRWKAWKEAYMNQHPIFASELEDPSAQHRRQRTLEQMRLVINDPGVPDTPHLEELKTLVSSWFAFRQAYDSLAYNRSGLASDYKADLRDRFGNWAIAFVQQNPTMISFYNSVLRPEMAAIGGDFELEAA